jgi:hypothetical protein
MEGMRSTRKGLVVKAYQWTPDLASKTPNHYRGKTKRDRSIVIDPEESLRYYRGELPEEVSHCDPFPEKIRLKRS